MKVKTNDGTTFAKDKSLISTKPNEKILNLFNLRTKLEKEDKLRVPKKRLKEWGKGFTVCWGEF